jgi:hypothetical protein
MVENVLDTPIPSSRTAQLDIPNLRRMPLSVAVTKDFFGYGIKGQEEILYEQEMLHKCPNVLIFSNLHGLGDTIMELRPSFAMAALLPQKQFTILVPDAIAQVPYFDVPKNVSLVSSLTKDQLQTITPDNTYCLNFYSPRPLLNEISEQMIKHDIPESERGRIEKNFREANNFSSIISKGIIGPANERYGFQFANEFDIKIGSRLRMLGIPISERDLEKPLFTFTKEFLHDHPQNSYDLLIAPDAAENEAVSGDRSIKSINAEKWQEIFASFPKDSQIGIIIGKTHETYCQAVLQKAQEAGLQVVAVTTPTLKDFVAEVAQAKTYVGMDSGTTHIAYEVMAAAEKLGRKIRIKEIFNASHLPMSYYGLRGRNNLVEILKYISRYYEMTVPDHLTNDQRITYLRDLTHIPADEVVKFLFPEKPKQRIWDTMTRLIHFLPK